MTAYGALIEYGKLQKGASVLITAGSSSVDLAAIQIVKSAGAVALATTRGVAKKQFLLDAGADHVIVTDESDIAEQAMAVTDGRGADILFDPVAGPFLEKLAQAAAPGADPVSLVGCPRQRPDHPRVHPFRDRQAAREYGPWETVCL